MFPPFRVPYIVDRLARRVRRMKHRMVSKEELASMRCYRKVSREDSGSGMGPGVAAAIPELVRYLKDGQQHGPAQPSRTSKLEIQQKPDINV